MRGLNKILPAVIKPLFKSEGYIYGSLVADWSWIVGSLLASQSYPEKIVFPKGQKTQGVLTLCVVSGSSPYIQHMHLQILDKINAYFGFKAIERLKIIQGQPLKRSSPLQEKPQKTLSLSTNQIEALSKLVEEIKTPSLQEALFNFGKALSSAE